MSELWRDIAISVDNLQPRAVESLSNILRFEIPILDLTRSRLSRISEYATAQRVLADAAADAVLLYQPRALLRSARSAAEAEGWTD
jgi:hypothetical protein